MGLTRFLNLYNNIYLSRIHKICLNIHFQNFNSTPTNRHFKSIYLKMMHTYPDRSFRPLEVCILHYSSNGIHLIHSGIHDHSCDSQMNNNQSLEKTEQVPWSYMEMNSWWLIADICIKSHVKLYDSLLVGW